LLGLGYLARNRVFGPVVPVVVATSGELTQSVVATGRVLTPQRVVVAAVSTARVRSVAVNEGQAVQQGQLLVQLDDQDLRATVAQAMAALAQAQAHVRQLADVGLPVAEQNLVQVQANASQAGAQLARVRDLQAQGFVGQAQLDEAQRVAQVARSAVRAAQLQVQNNRPTGSESALAQAALAQAQASLLLARVRLEQAALLAPAAGTLIARSVEPGETVQPGKALMVLAADGATHIAVQLDEKNLAKVALGQPAVVSADAYAAQRFAAEVVYINPGVDARRGAVEIKLRVIAPPPYLRQDMTVSVDIETARKNAAVILATGAVQDSNARAPWVWVLRDKHLTRQVVALGLRGDNQVEVLSGLQAGEAVVPAAAASAAGLGAGQRVRAKKATVPPNESASASASTSASAAAATAP
jgi:HlyD family secretion protein